MTVKTTGAQFKMFYADKSVWKDGAYHEYENLKVDGEDWADKDWGDEQVNSIPDSAEVVLRWGIFYASPLDYCHGTEFEAVLKRWLKNQKTSVVICEIAKERLVELKAAIVAAGGKVR